MIRPGPKRNRWQNTLKPAAGLYAAIMSMRNRRYDSGKNVTNVGVPVISVGNITAGGTGKTPTVIEVVRTLVGMQRKPAILTRGYGAKAGEIADEVQEYHEAVDGVPVVVNPDRVAGAGVAKSQHGADCLVLDDAFQHRRIARDLDIVLIDALNPWGGGDVFPAGLLREPMAGLARAGLFVINRTNQVESNVVAAIEATCKQYAPESPIVKASVDPVQFVGLNNDVCSLDSFRDQRIQPVCGIGNPGSFARLVEPMGKIVRQVIAFKDHHRYTDEDAKVIAKAAMMRGSDVVVTTRKDWGKLSPLWPRDEASPSLVRVDVRVNIHDDTGVFKERIEKAVEEKQ